MTHRVYSSGTRISLLGYGAAEIIALSGEENLEKMVRKIRAALKDLSSKKEEVVQ